MTKIVRDSIDQNIHFVLVNLRPAGYVEQFSPQEWKAFDAEGTFKGWFCSKKEAVNAVL